MSVYLDWAATEPMWPEVSELYREMLLTVGNPSSIHRHGQQARAHIDEARETLAAVLGADPMEVTFTSGATESINTWLKGRAWSHEDGVPTFLVPLTEHHATLDAAAWLDKTGHARILWVSVDSHARVDVDHLSSLLDDSNPGEIAGVMSLAANNEVGSLQPLDRIVEVSQHHGVPVHVDAVGMFGHLPFRWADRGLEAMSISAHKVGGPVGVGALIVSRQATPLAGLVHGGTQQTHRSGTLDVAGAVAFARAASLQCEALEKEVPRVRELRDRLKVGIDAQSTGVVWRGDPDERLPHNLHLTVSGCDGDALLYLLDEQGISVSTGSACQAGVPEPSHVLLAMGVDSREARGALRFTLGRDTTADDIDRVVQVFPSVVERARQAS
jgi:cysteine desulfurase